MEKYNVDKSLYIVIPCYNEEAVLPITAPMFLNKINSLIEQGLCNDKSKVVFVTTVQKTAHGILFKIWQRKMTNMQE